MEHLSRRVGATGAPPRTALTAVCLWTASALVATLGTALASRATALAGHTGRAQVDALVELGVLAAGVAVLAWLLVSCVLAAGCLTARAAGIGWRRGERWVHRWAPSVVRRAVVLAIGTGLGLSAATGASAADVVPSASPSHGLSAVAAPRAEVDLGWVPTGDSSSSTPVDRPLPVAEASSAPTGVGAVGGEAGATTAPAATAPTSDESPSVIRPAAETPTRAQESPRDAAGGALPAPAGAGRRPSGASPDPVAVSAPPARTVTVAPGDTLWAIAARHLPPGADDTSVAAAWPGWYAANTATIGRDPGLIRPGQVLTVPAETGAASDAGAAS